jgi:hypothetical protein
MAGLHLNYRVTRAIFLIGMSLLMVSALLATFTVSQVTANILESACSLYNTVHTVIFVIGLALIIIGASLYAGGNILPGNLKGTAQGYGMGMIVGGVVGVIIAISAPFILQTITGVGSTGNGNLVNCPTGPGYGPF